MRPPASVQRWAPRAVTSAPLTRPRPVKDPRGVLTQLCTRLGIAFDPAMLKWKAGPRDFDGVWAPHWYASVHRSTGFQPYAPKTKPFPARLRPLLDECGPYFDALARRAIRVT